MINTLNKIRNREVPNDVFYTPIELVKIHLKKVSPYVKPDDVIYDPFYGKGVYYNTFPEEFKKNKFEFSEIELGKDFFNFNGKVDVIISNPPYSIMNKVLQKSVELQPHTISFLIGLLNLTPKRIEFMNKYGYYLSYMYMTKVYKWFGATVIVIFSKSKNKNCMSFDRTIHR